MWVAQRDTCKMRNLHCVFWCDIYLAIRLPVLCVTKAWVKKMRGEGLLGSLREVREKNSAISMSLV